MFTNAEVLIANATYRSKGSSVYDKYGNIRSIVARFVASNVDKSKKILDFGCGTEFIQGHYLRNLGFDVDAWDFGTNKPKECVEQLDPIYDVVYASNVLNVISSYSMLQETLTQIKRCLKRDGMFIANYPQSPRKLNMTVKELEQIISIIFDNDAQKVQGVSCPMWIITNGNANDNIENVGA